LGSVTHSFW